MKMTNIIQLLCSIFLVSYYAVAEQPAWSHLHFSSTTIDFGHIAEEGGSVVRRFEATNTGDSIIYVTGVVSSCGCTTVDYSRDGIAPGEVFTLYVRYNPLNRPGRFERSVWVQTSESEEPIELNLRGYVQPRERPIEELYPFDLGQGMRLSANFHAFGYVEHSKSVEHRIGYVNNSDNEIVLDTRHGHFNTSGALTLEFPTVIAPHATGDICLVYSLGEDSTAYGTLNDIVLFTINGHEARYTLTTSAIAVDNFDFVDDISAPKTEIQKNIIKFGDVNCNSRASGETTPQYELTTTLRNAGMNDLVVRAVESTSEAVECSLVAGTTIEAGEQVTLSIRLYPERIEDIDNPFSARLLITTNDPMMPLRSIRITALPM